jgi:dienelactone hydrolase
MQPRQLEEPGVIEPKYPRARRTRVLSGSLALAALAVLASLLSPGAPAQPGPAAPAAPEPTSFVQPTDVAWTDLDWHDADRTRHVPARLYLPQAAGPWPLVVFSHGIGGSRAGYSHLGRHFASHGIASLHVQHVGSDRSLWAGNPLTLVSRLHGAAQEGEAIHRARDLSFALDRLLDGPHGVQVDRARIVAAGHSYGANTAMLAAGARVVRGGQPLALHDPRLRAVLLLSAPPFYGETDLASVLGAVAVPSLHVTTTDDVIRIPGYESPASDRIGVFDAIGGPRKALAVFAGGSHSVFTDRTGTGGGVALNQRIKAATQELAVAFVRSVVDGADAPLRDWSERHRGLVARYSDGVAR